MGASLHVCESEGESVGKRLRTRKCVDASEAVTNGACRSVCVCDVGDMKNVCARVCVRVCAASLVSQKCCNSSTGTRGRRGGEEDVAAKMLRLSRLVFSGFTMAAAMWCVSSVVAAASNDNTDSDNSNTVNGDNNSTNRDLVTITAGLFYAADLVALGAVVWLYARFVGKLGAEARNSSTARTGPNDSQGYLAGDGGADADTLKRSQDVSGVSVASRSAHPGKIVSPKARRGDNRRGDGNESMSVSEASSSLEMGRWSTAAPHTVMEDPEWDDESDFDSD